MQQDKKEIIAILNGKEIIKLYLFPDDMIIHMENKIDMETT